MLFVPFVFFCLARPLVHFRALFVRFGAVNYPTHLVLFVLFCQVPPLVHFRGFRAFFVLFGALSHIETHSHGPMDSRPPFCFSTKTHTHLVLLVLFVLFVLFGAFS